MAHPLLISTGKGTIMNSKISNSASPIPSSQLTRAQNPLGLSGLALVLGSAFITYSCAPAAPDQTAAPTDAYSSTSILGQTSLGGAAANPDESSCPDQANVSPGFNFSFNGSGYFKVCKTLTSTTRLLIQAQSNRNSSVCVFPAVHSANGQIFMIPDGSTSSSSALARCVAVPTSGYATIDFPNGTSFDSIYVVDQTDEAAMLSWVASQRGSVSTPKYSYGSLR